MVDFSRDLVSEIMSQLGGGNAAQRFLDCGESGRGWIGICPQGHEVYHSFRCMLRVCPHCSAQASRKLSEKLTPAVSKIVRESSASLGLKHITLTTNVCLLDYMHQVNGRWMPHKIDELRQYMQVLRGAAADMFKDRFRKKTKGHRVLNEHYTAGTGWAIGIEFGANLYLHFHVLALIPYFDQRDLSDLWRSYSFGRGFIVDIRAAGREQKDIEKAVGYVSKYVTKPLGKRGADKHTRGVTKTAQFALEFGSEPILAALWFLFRGVRRFQTYGSFFDLEIPPDELEVCSVCGSPLHWVEELDAIQPDNVWFFLNSLKTNNFELSSVLDPPKPIQLGLSGWDWLGD